MVNCIAAPLDAVFGALADPTRRAVLAQLRAGERSVGELASPHAMSLPGFIKHLGILEQAGLIARRKSGRVVSCTLRDGAAAEALSWLQRHEMFWNAQLDRLGTFVERQETTAWTPSPRTAPPSASAASTAPPSRPSTRRGRPRRR